MDDLIRFDFLKNLYEGVKLNHMYGLVGFKHSTYQRTSRCAFLITTFVMLLLSNVDTAIAESLTQFFEPIATEQSMGFDDVSDNDFNDNQPYLIDQTSRNYGEDQPIVEESRLDNSFYDDDGMRVYNHTLYSMDEVKSKYANAQADQVTMSDLSISLGYGMEFDVKEDQTVGYEYTSSFPHDRGQSIRLFWKIAF